VTFRDFCKNLDGQWVKVWTADSATAEDGTSITYSGKLTVHEDFLAMYTEEHDAMFGIPLAKVTAICERSDSKAKELERLVGPLEVVEHGQI
jgi:hypothetical protein